MCPSGKQAGLRKQPSETLIVQPAVETRLRVNGTLLQVDASSSTPALLPGSAATPTQSTPGLRVIEQCVVEAATGGPTLPPSVSYITLQIPRCHHGSATANTARCPSDSLYSSYVCLSAFR
ncbi:hypothetical protein FQA47_022581 [Oryzias melastigma]|uniref:Uncharacterized protein n=1 Tax=Oryzias melastigma TaxID=30732 RepID=A0A834F722_ORYME|nr:hypothetical protein FQA47_022581 [Oryzias melastigma]